VAAGQWSEERFADAMRVAGQCLVAELQHGGSDGFGQSVRDGPPGGGHEANVVALGRIVWCVHAPVARRRARSARTVARSTPVSPGWMSSIGWVTNPTPYLRFPGTAREALTFYGEVFGCAVQLHTFAEFNRTDGPADAVAHGYLDQGPVALFAADVAADEPAFRCEGMMLALLGTAPAPTLRRWFASLSEGGRVVDDLQTRPWGACDGQVIDRYGLHWLIGYDGDDSQ